MNGRETSCPTVKPIPLVDCARHLARLRSTAPPEKRGHIAVLEQQCREFPRDPGGMRQRILETIDRLLSM